eukprot:scaffold1708_cov322-Pavlova_lutheri.AAC.9
MDPRAPSTDACHTRDRQDTVPPRGSASSAWSTRRVAPEGATGARIRAAAAPFRHVHVRSVTRSTLLQPPAGPCASAPRP